LIDIAMKRGVAKVDDEDSLLAGFRWTPGSYPFRTVRADGRKTTVYLHRLVADRMGIPRGVAVDHVDRDRLNCRRSNLRTATTSQNARNRPGTGATGHRGVYWDATAGRWLAEVWLHGKRRWFRRFADVGIAVSERDLAAARIHGEFAFINNTAENS